MKLSTYRLKASVGWEDAQRIDNPNRSLVAVEVHVPETINQESASVVTETYFDAITFDVREDVCHR